MDELTSRVEMTQVGRETQGRSKGDVDSDGDGECEGARTRVRMAKRGEAIGGGRRCRDTGGGWRAGENGAGVDGDSKKWMLSR